ncbi:MAG TPA: hypothetical protein VMC03_20845 [Streptosporangiaceae bacterium]|nr:hypothetical protein [Streptosporangiaceae bacterium]
MGVNPTKRLIASRQDLQRAFDRHQDALGEPIGYGTGTAAWLVTQLPGADPRQLGWGILAVTAMLFPAQGEDGAEDGPRFTPDERSGERTSMILASRVGEALLECEPPAAGSAGLAEIGPELAACEMTAVYSEFVGPPEDPAQAADAVALRREFRESMAAGLAELRQRLDEELPGADLAAIGWALIGTGMSLLVQTSRIKPPRKLQRRSNVRTSAMRSSLLLAAVGDFLVAPLA